MEQPSVPADAAARHAALVDQLVKTGTIRSRRVEAAFRAVPRHPFLPGVALEEVYQDTHVATKRIGGRVVSSSSQPAMMAIMLEQLAAEPGQRVLEIGAGTGYNAALLAHIVGPGGAVTTLDVDPEIVAAARAHLAAAGVSAVRVVCADGTLGFRDGAPYDRVILTVGAAEVAPAWREQLRVGGRLVMPLVLLDDLQKIVAFEERDGCLESVSVERGGFMTLRGLGLLPGDPELRIRVEPRAHDDGIPWQASFTRSMTRIVCEYSSWRPDEYLAMLNARAARALELAKEEALGLNHAWLGAVHLLIGLLREGEGRAAIYLRDHGVELEAVRAAVAAAELPHDGVAPTGAEILWVPASRHVLTVAVEEARRLGHERVGTEHLLLSLAREEQALSTAILTRLGLDLGTLRRRGLTALSQVD
jgi:protein-L-isoaspartate(D-aspartate) O-methyltransferase